MTTEPSIPDDTPQQQQQEKQQQQDQYLEQENDDDSQSHHDKSRQYLNSSLSALRSCLRPPTTLTNTTANPTVIVMPPTIDDENDDSKHDTITQTTTPSPSSSDDDDNGDESPSLLQLSPSQNNKQTTNNNRHHLKKLLSISSYKERLRTFTPKMYFGKPTALSPLIAARCGWTNTSINTLTCPHCSATFTISLFHPQLGRDGTKTLCRYYQRKLLTSHMESCPFSLLARRYDDDEEVGGEREWVWSEDSTSQNNVRLMARLFDRWRSRRMIVVVPPLLDEVLRRDDWGVGEELSPLQRLCNVVRINNDADEEEEEERPLSEDGVLLSLLGWSPVPSSSTSGGNDETTCRSIMVECRVCLALASVPFAIASDDDTDAQGKETTITTTEGNSNNDETKLPKTKRRRMNTPSGMNPLTCHRSYCPYVTTRGISDCFQSPSSEEDDVGWMTVVKQLIQQNVSIGGVAARDDDDDDDDDKVRVTMGEETLAVVKSVFSSCLGTTTTTGLMRSKKTTTTTTTMAPFTRF